MKVNFPDKVQHKPYDSNPRVINNSDINELKDAINASIDGAELAEEIENRIEADANILSTVADNDTAINEKLNSEIESRLSVEADILEAIDLKANIEDVNEAISNVQSSVETEAISRALADADLLNKVNGRVSNETFITEVNELINEDNLLHQKVNSKASLSQLSTEITARQTAYADLLAKLKTETETRVTEQADIDARMLERATNLALALEIKDRKEADLKKVDKINGKGLSTNDYSVEDKGKVALLTGANTGDETAATIKTKLGVATSTTDGYLSKTDFSKFSFEETRLTLKTKLGRVDADTDGYLGREDFIKFSTPVSNLIDGYLTKEDYVKFSNPVVEDTLSIKSKLGIVSPTTDGYLGKEDYIKFSNPIIETGDTIKTKIGLASSTNDGYLSKDDFNKFNNPPQTEDTESIKSKLGKASSTVDGYLSKEDYIKFNNPSETETTQTIKQKLGVVSTISEGYLTSTDYIKFNGKADLVSGKVPASQLPQIVISGSTGTGSVIDPFIIAIPESTGLNANSLRAYLQTLPNYSPSRVLAGDFTWVDLPTSTGGGTIEKLATPSLTFTEVLNSSIKMTWNAITNATSYLVQRSTSSAFVNPVTVYTSSGTVATDTGLQASTLYYYRIRAIAAGFTSSDYGTFQSTTAVGNNITPAPVQLVVNDTDNTIIAIHQLGNTEIVYNINDGAWIGYIGTIAVGNYDRPYGYYKFKTIAAPGRNESQTVLSPAFTSVAGEPEPIPVYSSDFEKFANMEVMSGIATNWYRNISGIYGYWRLTKRMNTGASRYVQMDATLRLDGGGLWVGDTAGDAPGFPNEGMLVRMELNAQANRIKVVCQYRVGSDNYYGGGDDLWSFPVGTVIKIRIRTDGSTLYGEYFDTAWHTMGSVPHVNNLKIGGFLEDQSGEGRRRIENLQSFNLE